MKVRCTLMCALLLAVTSNPAAAESPFAVIVVELKAGEIEAEYRLSSPVRRLELARKSTKYRPHSWRILTPGIALEESALVATGGGTFDRVRVSVKGMAGPVQKDYTPVLVFSDGGRAVYTGQFDVVPAPDATAFQFKGSQKLPVALAGRLYRDSVSYTPVGDGTYVYFGTGSLLELPVGLAIVDPAIPDWVLGELRSFTPKVLAYFREQLGQQPAAYPFVLFDYDNRPNAGHGVGGDVLPGVVRLVLYGKDWADDNPNLRREIRWTIAHEAAHFWNSRNHEEAASWMHEGSADALANLALHDLGFMTSEQLADAQDEALNRCLLNLEGRSVNEAFRQGEYKTAYDCGHVLSLLTDAAMRQGKAATGLHEFWRTLLELSEKDGGFYHQGTYVANLSKQTGNTRLAAFVYTFTNQPFTGAQPLITAFAEAGRPLSQAHGEPSPGISTTLYAKLFWHLMGQDCGGRVSFHTLQDRIELLGDEKCANLKRTLPVTKLAGFSLFKGGHLAYAAVAEACRGGGSVALGVASPEKSDGIVALPCKTPLPALPALLTFRQAAPLGAARE